MAMRIMFFVKDKLPGQPGPGVDDQGPQQIGRHGFGLALGNRHYDIDA